MFWNKKKNEVNTTPEVSTSALTPEEMAIKKAKEAQSAQTTNQNDGEAPKDMPEITVTIQEDARRMVAQSEEANWHVHEYVTPDVTVNVSVLGAYRMGNTEDFIAIGKVNGTIKTDFKLYCENPGDDDNVVRIATIKDLAVDRQHVEEATNCVVTMLIENGEKFNLKTGTVIHSEDIEAKAITNAYISAIGDYFVGKRALDIDDFDFAKMSVTDCALAWDLFVWQDMNTPNQTKEQAEATHGKINKFAERVKTKFFDLDEIYVIMNPQTKEPHMFSAVIDRKDGTYTIVPPDIWLVTSAYAKLMRDQLEVEGRYLMKVENGADKKGIFNFLGQCFYMNGVCGVKLVTGRVAYEKSFLVPEPDYSNTPDIQVPVTNPFLTMWMLFIGQLGTDKSEEDELKFRLYYGFMSQELQKAKLLVPMKHDGEVEHNPENNTATFKSGAQIMLASRPGKGSVDCIMMYTDWKRFREAYNEEWEGMIATVDDMIERFDVAINCTENPAVGAYISQEHYQAMKGVKG